MARPKIRWKAGDERELRLAVKAFNERIRYYSKRTKNPIPQTFLPDKVSYKTLRSDILTRSELNQKLNSLRRFNNDTAKVIMTEEGYNVLLYDFNELKEKTRIRNIQKSYGRKKYGLTEASSLGVQQQITELGLRQKDFKTPKSRKAFDYAMMNLENQLMQVRRDEALVNYRTNYRAAIHALGVNESVLNAIISVLSDEELFEMTVANPKLEINYYYEGISGITESNLVGDIILEEWLRVLDQEKSKEVFDNLTEEEKKVWKVAFKNLTKEEKKEKKRKAKT